MSEEILPYEIFIVLPANLNSTDQLSPEEQEYLKATEVHVALMSPAVRRMSEVALAKCLECNWMNVPSKYLYTARIAIASVEPYVAKLQQAARDTSAHLKGNG